MTSKLRLEREGIWRTAWGRDPYVIVVIVHVVVATGDECHRRAVTVAS